MSLFATEKPLSPAGLRRRRELLFLASAPDGDTHSSKAGRA
jgi:hypothetical protein